MTNSKIVMVPGERGMKLMDDDILTIETPVVIPWNDDLAILKYKLQTLLKDNIVEVTFTKVNGDLRTMKCTLKSTLLPERLTESKGKIFPENVLPVWDIEKNAFRSFRVDHVHDYIAVSGKG